RIKRQEGVDRPGRNRSRVDRRKNAQVTFVLRAFKWERHTGNRAAGVQLIVIRKRVIRHKITRLEMNRGRAVGCNRRLRITRQSEVDCASGAAGDDLRVHGDDKIHWLTIADVAYDFEVDHVADKRSAGRSRNALRVSELSPFIHNHLRSPQVTCASSAARASTRLIGIPWKVMIFFPPASSMVSVEFFTLSAACRYSIVRSIRLM